MKTRIEIRNAADVDRAAREFVAAMPPSRVYAFNGAMGAGKTTFISAIVRALGVDGEATGSPSFAIVNEYGAPGRDGVIYHFDLYRLEDVGEALDMGFEDYVYSGGLCLIEWPGIVESLLPDDTVNVEISVNDDESRTVTLDY